MHSNENSIKKILKNKNNVRKKNQKDVARVYDLFFFFFAQKVDDMLSVILFKRNKIDLAFFPCFDFDH